jgi:hypothetical protein
MFCTTIFLRFELVLSLVPIGITKDATDFACSKLALTRLFLNYLQLDRKTVSVARIASLETLGMVKVGLSSGTLAAECFPRLRHLAIYDAEHYFCKEDAALLTSLAPRLDSASFKLSAVEDVLSEVPSLEYHSILFNLSWRFNKDWVRVGYNIVHLRILVSHFHRKHDTDDTCDQAIDKITSTLETAYPKLESLYLPLLDSLPPDYRSDEIVNSLQKLALTCERRNVEVIFEEQSDRFRAESLGSEEFMRRMTKKRGNREASETKETAEKTERRTVLDGEE